MSSWTEIVFRLFAWLRPLLWYYRRLGNLLEAVLFAIENEDYLLWLSGNPEGRADFEAKVADGEHCLDVAIALRARELLGLPALPQEKPGIETCARIHSAPSLERLVMRVLRLAHRYEDIERLARLRAHRIRRESEAAPVILVADHRPHAGAPRARWLWLWLWRRFFTARSTGFPRGASPVPAGLRIRAPP